MHHPKRAPIRKLIRTLFEERSRASERKDLEHR